FRFILQTGVYAGVKNAQIIEVTDFRMAHVSGVSAAAQDHGTLAGLNDDDHAQYVLADGTRALAGAWDMGSQNLTNVNIDSGTIDGVTITSPVLDGTVTNTGATLVMPAFTAGGLISANGYIDMATGTSIRNSLTTGGHWFGLTARDVDGSAWVALARVINANDPYIDFGTAGGALKIYGSNKIELQNTLTLNGQVFDAGSGYCEIDTTGKVGLLMDGGITSGGVAASNCLQNYFGGNFVSGGVGNHAAKLFVGGELLGFENDTGTLSVVRLFGSVKTQDSADDVISVVSQLWLREPTITVQGSTTITVAATLYIDGAPTEGVTDAAIYVASGDTNLPSATLRGNIVMAGNAVTGHAQAITDNAMVTVDGPAAGAPASGEYGRWTASGLEGRSKAEQLSDLNVADGADVTGSTAPQAHKASHQDIGGDEISVTALSGLLADDQHVLDAEVIAAAIDKT
ncbi:hypothetical protein LCGC14_2627890, partial [marine sediment metagenome]